MGKEKMAEEAPTTEQAKPKPLSLLAKERFGSDFYGEVTPTEATDESSEVIESDNEAQTEEVQEEVEAQDTQEETQDTETGSEESSETEEVPISSLSELIEHQGWDPEWVNSIEVSVKVDGETSAVPLKELVDKHQMNAAADKRLEEAKAKAQEANQRLEEQAKQTEQEYAVALQLVEHMETQLESFSSGVDWNSLRRDDPAEYAAKKAEFQEQRGSIEKLKQDARQKYQEWSSKSQASEEQIREYAQGELKKLAEKVPEVADSDKAPEWQKAMAKYMAGEGFTKEELANAYDHRLLVLAHKARLYDEGSKKVDAAKKKVAKVRKIMKPGAAKTQSDIDSKKVKQARSRLHKTGTVDDAFNLLRATRGG